LGSYFSRIPRNLARAVSLITLDYKKKKTTRQYMIGPCIGTAHIGIFTVDIYVGDVLAHSNRERLSVIVTHGLHDGGLKLGVGPASEC
jgi:hypothetical protein